MRDSSTAAAEKTLAASFTTRGGERVFEAGAQRAKSVENEGQHRADRARSWREAAPSPWIANWQPSPMGIQLFGGTLGEPHRSSTRLTAPSFNSFVKLRRGLRCVDPDVIRAIVSAFRLVSEEADQARGCGEPDRCLLSR